MLNLKSKKYLGSETNELVWSIFITFNGVWHVEYYLYAALWDYLYASPECSLHLKYSPLI